MNGPGQIGVCLERPSGPDRASGQILYGDMGAILRHSLHHYGVDVQRECTIIYAVPEGSPTGERIALVRPHVERVQQELAHCTKILACGPMAMAAVWPLSTVPTKFHKIRGRSEMSAWGSPPKLLVPSYSLQQVWAEPDYYRDFAFDVQKIVHQDAPHPRPDVEVVVVKTVDELRYWLDRISASSILAVDLETTGFDPLVDTIDSIGLGVMYPEGARGLTVIIPRDLLYPPRAYVQGLLLYFLGPRSPYKGTIVYQNCQFDLRHLRMYLGDWPFHPHISDTLMLNYALDERPIGRFGVHSLKDMSRYRFDIEDYSFDWEAFRATPPEERDMATMYAYNAQDCYLTAKLHEVLTEEAKNEDGLEEVVTNILVPTAKAVAKVVLTGVLIDQDYLRQYREKLLRQIAEREQALKDFAAQHGVPDLLPSSPMQVANFIFGTLGFTMPKIRMKGPRRSDWSTSKAVIDKIRLHATEEQREFFDSLLAYRLYSRTLNAYVDGLLEQVGTDGRVHPEIFIAGTATGRLSCARPALQQIPVHVGPDVRKAFIAPPGYSLVEVDMCLHPDTGVETIGGIKRIGDIIPGDKLFTLRERRIAWGEVTHVAARGELECYQLTFDNGETVIASTTHRWPVRIRHSRYNYETVVKRTDELVVGERMIPMRRVSNAGGYVNLYAYSAIEYTHEAALVAEAVYGPCPEGMHIHHLDGNPANNHPSNLTYKNAHDHKSDHSRAAYAKASPAQQQAVTDRLLAGLEQRRTYAGAGNPNYGKRRAPDSTCLHCGTTFNRPPSRQPALYCSVPCYAQARKDGLNHKVVAIEYVGLQPTVSITVEPDHNYVLACGVVTQNSQVEMRFAGWASREPVLINAFASGQDIYRMTASQVFGIPVEQVSDVLRQLSKSVALGLLYGRSGAAIAEGREMDAMEAETGNRWDKRQAEEFHDQFLAGMPQLARWIKEQIEVGMRTHRSVTPFGRVRRFPLVTSYNRSEVERQLVNSYIQGGSADITTLSMVKLVDQLPDGADIVLTVHDSLVCQVQDSIIPTVVRQIRDVMEHPPSPPIDDRGVAWATSVKVGKNWGEMQKYRE